MVSQCSAPPALPRAAGSGNCHCAGWGFSIPRRLRARLLRLAGSYLGLDRVLGSVHPVSRSLGKEAHDEHLFISTHQAYEIWFQQIIHELRSVIGEARVRVQRDSSIRAAPR